MWFLTSVLSALLFGFAGFSMKYGTHVKASSKHVLLGLYLSGSVGFSLWTTYRGQWEVSLSLLLAGIIVGIGSAFGNEPVYESPASGTGKPDLPARQYEHRDRRISFLDRVQRKPFVHGKRCRYSAHHFRHAAPV